MIYRSTLHNTMNAETINAVVNEAARAKDTYGVFNSPHEVLGVLAIELHEMGMEVHARCWSKARTEAIQIAAVAMRFADGITKLERDGVL